MDVNFCSLAVRVFFSDAFSECLEAEHLRLDPASDVVSGTALSGRRAIVPGTPQRLVSCDCG